MKQDLALEVMRLGKNVLLTGAAGTGKTYVLNKFIQLARSENKVVSVTATTGLAATHLSGTTIHSWSGIGVKDSLEDDFFDSLSKARREIIYKTDILIIDEISMMHDYRLDMIDQICRKVRSSDKPFGGLQLILCGDFFQLPPVNKAGSRFGQFIFNSQVWDELDMTICYLDEQYRHDDTDLIDILSAIRSGDLDSQAINKLSSRLGARPEDSDILVTQLFTINMDVDSFNDQKLAKIDGKQYSYQQVTTGPKKYITTLNNSILAPSNLRIKIEALVMAVKNNPDSGYFNGSLGKVVDFESGTNYPVVEFKNGKVVTVKPESWELIDGDRVRASVSQIPLRLAWAITVHKAQGMTLDSAQIDLKKAFVEGMGYVALSRVKNLSSLYLSGFSNMALRVSQEASSVDDKLRQLSSQAEADFSYLLKREQPVTVVKPKKSGWSEKIISARQAFPNDYRPWSRQDDALLKERFLNGDSVATISKILKRNSQSVGRRLKNYFLEDVI